MRENKNDFWPGEITSLTFDRIQLTFGIGFQTVLYSYFAPASLYQLIANMV